MTGLADNYSVSGSGGAVINHGLYTDTVWAVPVTFKDTAGQAINLAGQPYVAEIVSGSTVIFRFRSSGAAANEGTLGLANAATGVIMFNATIAQHASVAAGLYRVHLKRDLAEDVWTSEGTILIGKPGAKETYLLFDAPGAESAGALSYAQQAAASAATAVGAAAAASTDADDAAASATAAASSQSAAAASATAAAASQSAAASSQSAAAGSATAAASSASAAAASEAAADVSEAASSTSATAAAGSATASQNSRLASEAARDASVTAKTASESARDAAVVAKTAAETAETNAETAEVAAEAAQAAAEAARNAAQTSATQASTSKDAAAASATAAASSASAASADRVLAETARTGAETARTGAQTAQTAAETARTAAQTAQTGAETARTAAQTAQTAAETARTGAQSAQAAAAGSQATATTAAQTAAAQASLAQGYAASASSVVQQDLSAVTAQALHRSPNAITSMFIYDTSKDSDGGAWTDKCQHTSWWNEPLMGKWLGAQSSEFYARYEGATVGAELLTNNSFDLTTGWSTATLSIGGGVASLIASSQITLSQSIALTAGRLYRVVLNIRSHAGGFMWVRFTGGTAVNSAVFGGAGRHVFYLTAASGNNNLLLEASGATPQTALVIEDISVREVTALNTASGDYFQLTTDGKFYRLWKNVWRYSTDMTNAVWGRVDANIEVSGSAFRLTPLATNAVHRIGQSVDMSLGQVTVSVEAKADGYSKVNLTEHVNSANSSQNVDLANGTTFGAAPNIGTTTVASLGDGWYRIIWQTTTLAQLSNNSIALYVLPDTAAAGFYPFNTSWTPDGTKGVLIRNFHVEYGSNPAPVYEAKGADFRLSETFRGNKADFPRLAAIVSEGLTVSIYDLTEPGRPMWMRFVANSGYTLDINAAYPITSLAAMNGKIIVGSRFPNNTSDGSGIVVLDFPRDGSTATAQYGSTDRQTLLNRNTANPGISPSAILPHPKPSNINAIAMTVLPDAPVDPTTGLRVPTIALATGSGMTIIKHDGTTVNNTGASTTISIAINKDMVIGTTYAASQYQLNPGSLANNFSLTANAFSNGSSPDYYRSAWHVSNKLTGKTKVVSGSMYGPVAAQVLVNLANRARSITSIATNTHNTGWLPGDIRRAYLSDTDIGSVSGAELVTNGTFDVDATGWSGLGPATVSGGTINVSTSSGQYWIIQQTIPTVVGRTYRISLDIVSLANNAGTAYVGIGWGPANGIAQFNNTGTKTATVTATGTSVVLCFYFLNATASLDNISVREVVFDRSYKAASALPAGTITRSQLATGTSLVGYSGFSAANYLREPYSADLDFGTGEWSCSAWVNVPVTGAVDANFNLIAAPENFADATWDKTGTNTIVANAATDPFGGNAATRFGSDNRIFFYFSTRIFLEQTAYTFSIYAKADVGSVLRVLMRDGFTPLNNTEISFNLATGTADNANVSMVDVGSGWYRCIITATTNSSFPYIELDTPTLANTVFIYGAKLNKGSTPGTYTPGRTAAYAPTNAIAHRSPSSAPAVTLGVNYASRLVATAFDGTTTRTVTTTAAYNTASWLKAEACYTTDGTLSIRVNGREVATTRGNPLLSLNSRYNLIASTEDFSSASWSALNAPTRTPAYAASPTGTMTATRLQLAASTGGEVGVQQTYATTAGANIQYRAAVYLKSNTGADQQVRIKNTHNGVVDNVQTVTVTSSWQLFTYTVTNSASAGTGQTLGILNTIDNTAKDILVWGADLRFGALSALPYQRVGAATDFDFQAPLTIGNSYALDAPFPGSIALLKLGATVPTPEQSQMMYEQEKQLFRAGAQSVLPDSGSIVDMAYDDATDRWVAISATNESYWTGLVRNSVTPSPAGSYTKVTAGSGIELVARSTTNPGVDVTIPAYGLREELVERAEAAARLSKELAIYDYVGGFTANTTSGSTAITNVSTITYPASYVGARISGSGIPTNTTIVAVSGTTLYLSAAATATATGVSISFLDFELPVGMEAKAVISAGAVKQEGATKDYTRLYDGFIETIRFGVAPGATAWVQIQAQRITLQ